MSFFENNNNKSPSSSSSHNVYIAIGSNIGVYNRLQSIEAAIHQIQQRIGVLQCTSSLYETLAAYVDGRQEMEYLNCVIKITTILSPQCLLTALQNIELELGRRQKEQRMANDARTIDLDILLFDDVVIESSNLIIPHPRITERNFVLFPLVDILPTLIHPVLQKSFKQLLDENIEYGKQLKEPDGRWAIPTRCIPARDTLWHISNGYTRVAGIVNVSPESFSDGYTSNTKGYVDKALKLIEEGADIIDIGGVSTAPGSPLVPEDVELQRLIPTIEALRQQSNIVISVDTRSAKVMERCLDAGADMVNDISFASFDNNMLELIRRRNITAVLMHMKGNPMTMDNETTYEDVATDVARYLKNRAIEFERSGIPRWRMILDIGLGFSKTYQQNFELLRDIKTVQSTIPTGIPLYVGFSRKRYIGSALKQESAFNFQAGVTKLNEEEIEERKWGGAAIVSWTSINAIDFIRTHDVKEACCVRDTMALILQPNKLHNIVAPPTPRM